MTRLDVSDVYDEYDLDNDDLSQAIEAAGTPTGALIPWYAGALYMADVTGVETAAYAPYYLFGILSPLVLFAIAATGFGLPSANLVESTPTSAD